MSPLKHQPEVSETEADGKSAEEQSKEDAAVSPCAVKSRGLATGALFGELEHYDLDMDEILDVPYIKSSQQTATLPRVASEKRSAAAGVRGATLAHSESLSGGTQFCVLSPVSWPDMRKSKSVDLRAQGFDHSHGSETDKLLPFPDKPAADGGQTAFPLQGAKGTRGGLRAFGDGDEEAKKTQNILNIVREGQISLLVRASPPSL